ncbi:MAG TPA: hypothetical protein VGJ08_16275 [Rhizomicrobium sp.]|jgi:hypothetical protein
MKSRLCGVVAAVTFAWSGIASPQYADQDEPQHGGVTNWNTNSEYSFELVSRKTGVTLYIEDHEAPVPTKGAKGTLVIRGGATSNTKSLVPAGDNRMVAPRVSTKPGDQVVATVTLANGTVMIGRFVVL